MSEENHNDPHPPACSPTTKRIFDSIPIVSHELGTSLPQHDEHAVSVSMPKWEHIIRYEEGCPDLHNSLSCGYPRFVYHPFVQELNSFLQLRNNNTSCRTFPTREAAQRAIDFVKANTLHHSEKILELHSVLDTKAATFVKADDSYLPLIKLYWQHSGEILSSRFAQYLLSCLRNSKEEILEEADENDHAVFTKLTKRVVDVSLAKDSSNVFLFPTGMATIFTCHRILREIRGPRCKSVMFGFPYLDSLKLLKRPELSAGVYFFPKATEDDFEALQEILNREAVVAIFTEFPGNPLPRSTDISRLACMARKNGTVLVIDDTIASFNLNIASSSSLDNVIVVTSLTKIFTGACNVMGGSIILNPNCILYEKLKKILNQCDTGLFVKDARILLAASADLIKRLLRVNASANVIVDRLKTHPAIANVFYPKYVDKIRYESFLKSCKRIPQYGPVFSVLLHGGKVSAQKFYDSIKIAKGPSLGTNFTLCCPYTMLAHYDELEFVESCGIDRNLIRFSIGLEAVEDLWKCFEDAFKFI